MIFSQALCQENHFEVKTNVEVGDNTEFWKAAGSDHLFYHSLKPAGQYLLKRMGTTDSHHYLRSHHTFNQDIKNGVIRGQNVYSEDSKGNPIYDFSNLNKVFKAYVENGIKPIVEYDYLPEALSRDKGEVSIGNDEGMTMINTGPNDWEKWSDLMKATTQNFIDEFGIDEVRTWYFEVWNEPDGWPEEEWEVFYKMYDIFVDAVTSVDSKLKVGGPACYHEYFLKPFLSHVVNGTNYVTGKKGSQIDFISYHIYGLSGKWLNNEPHIQPQVQRFSQSVLWLKRLLKAYPSLKDTEFHINEWGLSSNYYRTVAQYPDLEYRNSISSPLFLFKLVDALYQIEDHYNFPTSLLLYWGFSWEADEDEFFTGKRELLTAGNTPKPIQTGFEMLAQLQPKRLKVLKSKKSSRLGMIATGYKEKIVLLLYNYEESDEEHVSGNDIINIQLSGLENKFNYEGESIVLDKKSNNTYQSWITMGSPKNSKSIDLATLKKAATLDVSQHLELETNASGEVNFEINLKRRSAQILVIQPKN
jgi:xylan 1,4-beta-xylosidase